VAQKSLEKDRSGREAAVGTGTKKLQPGKTKTQLSGQRGRNSGVFRSKKGRGLSRNVVNDRWGTKNQKTRVGGLTLPTLSSSLLSGGGIEKGTGERGKVRKKKRATIGNCSSLGCCCKRRNREGAENRGGKIAQGATKSRELEFVATTKKKKKEKRYQRAGKSGGWAGKEKGLRGKKCSIVTRKGERSFLANEENNTSKKMCLHKARTRELSRSTL